MSEHTRKFRIFWGPEPYASDLIEAETAEDALTIARLNFARFGHEPLKMEYEKQSEGIDKL